MYFKKHDLNLILLAGDCFLVKYKEKEKFL